VGYAAKGGGVPVIGGLALLEGKPWLLGAMGLGLVFYGLYQWVKARYRIVGV
jgi:hypothetical protein